jgi:holo-[acyl-carrier protein] synthase
MIHGIGIDIAEISRVWQAQERNARFAQRVLTVNELAVFTKLTPKRQAEYLTGRFAVKEAYSKALRSGIGKQVGFLDLELLNKKNGAPYFAKYPQSETLKAHVSLSHSTDLVIAEVILEKNEEKM